MKLKSLLLITSLVLNMSLYAQTVSIGTASGTIFSIFNMQDPYTRHAGLYTSSQIGTTGTITSLGWNISHIWSNGDGPVKIYLKENATFLNSDSWASLKTGATVVYNGTVTFPASASDDWFTINLTTPFNYSSGNLLVMVESNYGGSGNGGIGGGVDFNSFNVNSGYDEFWWGNPIQTTGTSSTSQPMLQITFGTTTALNNGTVDNKASFSIFPNPATESFYYSTNQIVNADLLIFDMQGNQVYGGKITYQSDGIIDISFLQKGCYIIRITNNKLNLYKRLMVQ